MKKVITQKQTNILSNNFYRGWHNKQQTLTPIPSDRIVTDYNHGYIRYRIWINLDGIALVGQTYCLPQEVMDDIINLCDNEVPQNVELQIEFYFNDIPSGFNFSHYFGETPRDLKPIIFMQHSTDQEDSNFYAPVLHIYNEPGDYDEVSNGGVGFYFTASNSCTLDIATCGPIININWGW